MHESIFVACVYYYSLPQFPNDCNVVKDNSLFIRDVLVSNRHNPHIKLGGQYDPHYENNPLPEYKMCWTNARRMIMSKIDAGTYDQIYLLFRTNKTRLCGGSTQNVAGYYEIDKDKTAIDPEYGEPLLHAREARFTNLENAPSLSSFLEKYRNPRFLFTSETKNGEFNRLLDNWRNRIDAAPNLFSAYVEETKQLDRLFKYYEFDDQIYETCEDCSEIKRCPLMKRIHKKGKLYHQLPEDVALRIERYYRTLCKVQS
jgi:hypothetical protein